MALVPSVSSLDKVTFGASFIVMMSDSITGWSDLVGDFDRNGSEDFAIFLAFSDCFGKAAGEQDSVRDFDASGSMDFSEFPIFSNRAGDSR